MIRHIDVHAALQASVSGRYTDLVTRATGRAVREAIERVIGTQTAAVALMDFSGVGCLDYSCADEIVAKLLRDRVQVLLLRGVTDAHREALEPVLLGHGLAALVQRTDGTLEALGRPEPAAALVDELVALRLAARTPGGGIAFVAA